MQRKAYGYREMEFCKTKYALALLWKAENVEYPSSYCIVNPVGCFNGAAEIPITAAPKK